MCPLPVSVLRIVAPFASLFSARVWQHVQVLLGGALLAPAQRTVTAALRTMGLAQVPQFHRSHRVLSRARWSSVAVSRVRLPLLVAAFAPAGPLIFGRDETVERRRGRKIAAKGIYRDAVRSSHSHFVKASGLRWVCLMLRVPIPWAARSWALPILTALAPSERDDREHGRRHKTLPDWARQLFLLGRRWYPHRALVAVADRTYAAIPLVARCRSLANPITLITRLRLDAALSDPPRPRRPGQRGCPRLKGKRLPTLAATAAMPTTSWTPLTVRPWSGFGERLIEVASGTALWYHTGMPPVAMRWVLIRDPQGRFATQALLCTDLDATPQQIVSWFFLRWQLEVTFEEVRRHLGVETQRQWSDLAIRRTTPALLGLFSLVTRLAHHHITDPTAVTRQASWYRKNYPTFADALALIRRDLWCHHAFATSPAPTDLVHIPRPVWDRLTTALAYVA